MGGAAMDLQWGSLERCGDQQARRRGAACRTLPRTCKDLLLLLLSSSVAFRSQAKLYAQLLGDSPARRRAQAWGQPVALALAQEDDHKRALRLGRPAAPPPACRGLHNKTRARRPPSEGASRRRPLRRRLRRLPSNRERGRPSRESLSGARQRARTCVPRRAESAAAVKRAAPSSAAASSHRRTQNVVSGARSVRRTSERRRRRREGDPAPSHAPSVEAAATGGPLPPLPLHAGPGPWLCRRRPRPTWAERQLAGSGGRPDPPRRGPAESRCVRGGGRRERGGPGGRSAARAVRGGRPSCPGAPSGGRRAPGCVRGAPEEPRWLGPRPAPALLGGGSGGRESGASAPRESPAGPPDAARPPPLLRRLPLRRGRPPGSPQTGPSGSPAACPGGRAQQSRSPIVAQSPCVGGPGQARPPPRPPRPTPPGAACATEPRSSAGGGRGRGGGRSSPGLRSGAGGAPPCGPSRAVPLRAASGSGAAPTLLGFDVRSPPTDSAEPGQGAPAVGVQ